MDFFNKSILRLKGRCIIYFNLLLFIAKAILTLAICIGLKSLIPSQDLWLWPVWIVLSVMIDSLLIFKKPSLFTNVLLTEEDQKKYFLNSQEFREYLCFSPKARLGRILCVTFVTFTFLSISNWANNLPIALIVGFVFIDPLIKKLFNIKTPKFFTPDDSEYIPSTPELHKDDISFAGSPAWTAVQSIKQFDNIPPPKI